jgi:hypothetical protein
VGDLVFLRASTYAARDFKSISHIYKAQAISPERIAAAARLQALNRNESDPGKKRDNLSGDRSAVPIGEITEVSG